MTRDDKRHYWIIHADDYDIDWNTASVEDLCDIFIVGLEKNVKYISVINKKGENIYITGGHSTENFEEMEQIEVYDKEGNLNITETANAISKDFLNNRALIALQFEKDLYEELGTDKGWINNILEDE